jgi:hypothetical protein
MKKIITLFDVTNAPWHVLTFAIKIAKGDGIPLTGVFLSARDSKTSLRYPFPNDMSLTGDKLSNEIITRENALLMDDNIKLFTAECVNEGITFEIQKNVSIESITNECMSIDLIVADTRADFLDELLPKISCPVCLASENNLPEKVVLMLDEGDSSRNAIEKFAQLFPRLSALPSEVVSINLTKDQQMANEEYVKQHLHQHFSSLTQKNLQGNTRKELLKFLGKEQEHVMVVMGAFGRSGVSMFFKESLADVVLRETRLSLFIVHR